MTLIAISDEITRWGLTLGFALVAIFAAYLMRAAWVRRASDFENLAPLPVLPEVPESAKRFPGRYLATTLADVWLERITAQGLGAPSRAEVILSDNGITFLRTGAADFHIPLNQLQAVRTDRAIGGKAYEADGILIFTWQHGGLVFDTGFRADTSVEQLEILETMESAVRQ